MTITCTAAIIDLDGTLLDTVADITAALDLMLLDLDLPPTQAERVARLIGTGGDILVRKVLHAAMPDPAQADALFERACERYRAHYLVVNGRHASVYPGVAAGLQRLKERGIVLACVTNKPTVLARPLLQGQGLAGYFHGVYGGEQFERLKPDPLPLLKTCEALGTAPSRTLMVGDSVNDAKAARAAGCPVVLVTYGYNHGQPVRAVDADGFVDSLEDLPIG
jgi:phosphoglycolate phosphatase